MGSAMDSSQLRWQATKSLILRSCQGLYDIDGAVATMQGPMIGGVDILAPTLKSASYQKG